MVNALRTDVDGWRPGGRRRRGAAQRNGPGFSYPRCGGSSYRSRLRVANIAPPRFETVDAFDQNETFRGWRPVEMRRVPPTRLRGSALPASTPATQPATSAATTAATRREPTARCTKPSPGSAGGLTCRGAANARCRYPGRPRWPNRSVRGKTCISCTSAYR